MVIIVRFNLKDYDRGEVIKFIREWTELTQQDFADHIGKSKRTIEEYEAGAINYGIDVLMQIAKEFHIDIIIEKKR